MCDVSFLCSMAQRCIRSPIHILHEKEFRPGFARCAQLAGEYVRPLPHLPAFMLTVRFL
jgi:hypothetical protein